MIFLPNSSKSARPKKILPPLACQIVTFENTGLKFFEVREIKIDSF